MSNPKLICELCREEIGEVLIEKLSHPMTGEMFLSCDAEHGRPAPFEPQQTWADMRCPYGRSHRPFIEDNAIFTSDGWLIAREDKFHLTRELSAEFRSLHYIELTYGDLEKEDTELIKIKGVVTEKTGIPDKKIRKRRTKAEMDEFYNNGVIDRKKVRAAIEKHRNRTRKEAGVL